MEVGGARLLVSGTHFKLGDPILHADIEERDAPPVPPDVHADLLQLRFAIQALTAEIHAVRVVLSQPPWIVQVWASVQATVRGWWQRVRRLVIK